MERAMIGVVLWSDAEAGKAVIWCEDHGDLAFYSTPEGDAVPRIFFDAGDMVSFEIKVERSMRCVTNPTLVVEKAGQSLPEALRHLTSAPAPRSEAGASVVKFEQRPHGAKLPVLRKRAAGL